MNARMRGDNTSSFKGVSWDKHARKWAAYIHVNGKKRHLGCFDSPERAFIEYIFAAWRNFGDFAQIDADYIRVIRELRRLKAERKAFEHIVLWNRARPDYLTAA